jgi:hypothetical protein
MGCHTWFHTKSDPQPSYEEVREKLIKLFQQEKDWYFAHANGTIFEEDAWLFEGKDQKESEYFAKVMDRYIRRLENRTCKIATMRRVWMIGNFYYCEKNGQIYSEVDKHHDLFRIGGYPNDELLSFEETLKFIEDNEDRIAFGPMPTDYGKNEVIRRLQLFWDEFPEGMIRFG